MTNKLFHRDDYPLDVLGEFGLTENMLYDLPDFVHENLEMGGLSPLLPIKIEQPFGYSHCYAKFCLRHMQDGVGVMFAPKLKEANLSNFRPEERDLLLQGKVIIANIDEPITKEDGTEDVRKVKAFVQLDMDTNGVVYAPSKIIGRNIQTIADVFDMDDESIESLCNGELVSLTEKDRAGNPINVTVGINLLSDKFVVLFPGNAMQWNRAANKKMPEYSFGNDGCWVNKNGVLRYVDEDHFTQDILEAMERQKRQSGILQEMYARPEAPQYSHDSQEVEESRQITR